MDEFQRWKSTINHVSCNKTAGKKTKKKEGGGELGGGEVRGRHEKKTKQPFYFREHTAGAAPTVTFKTVRTHGAILDLCGGSSSGRKGGKRKGEGGGFGVSVPLGAAPRRGVLTKPPPHPPPPTHTPTPFSCSKTYHSRASLSVEKVQLNRGLRQRNLLDSRAQSKLPPSLHSRGGQSRSRK